MAGSTNHLKSIVRPGRSYLVEHYGDDGTWDWDEIIYYRIDPTWMVAYSDDPTALFDIASPPA